MTETTDEDVTQIPAIFEPLFTRPRRKNMLFGGRGSAKSHSVARFCVSRAQESTIRILCTRELQKSIAESVHQLLCDCIHNMGLDAEFIIQRDKIYHKYTKSEFIFAGVRQNTNEIKSMENISICWVEEAQAMSQQSLDVLIPTIRASGSILIFTFNPFKDSDPVYVMTMRALEENDPDTLVINANYDDNPFFPDELRREMEHDKKTDYDKYLWVWEGKCLGISKAQIFRGKYEVREFEAPFNAMFHYGADWGFSNDPTALTRSFIIGNDLYIDYEAWEVGCDIDRLPELFNQIPGTCVYPIYADNARPETISYMQSRRYNVIAAEKWSGSIEDGISYIRGFDHVYIHPRCKHTIEEFELYQYKVDRQTNEVLRVPLDRYNHCIDSLRYAHVVTMRAGSNGKVYDSFTMDNIYRESIVYDTVYVGTLILPGKTFILGATFVNGLLYIVNDYESRGEVNFKFIRELYPADKHLLWMPFDVGDNISPKMVEECEQYGIEPAVGCVLPADNEGSLLLNRLFEGKGLFINERATNAITALNERTFQANGELEKKTQAVTYITKVAQLLEYLIWRVVGRIG